MIGIDPLPWNPDLKQVKSHFLNFSQLYVEYSFEKNANEETVEIDVTLSLSDIVSQIFKREKDSTNGDSLPMI